ncbi:hypothetical protein FNV43_RR01494 [Rhamnella rubrinervis]|uniref:Uncharacterized protein n=1 Tax=Rhamnella rubrinervis TaxID=2594499 RepID=A0A8K0HSC5_9ROSA|nr:hypothetical protein FNV43_RR01494 [Rhamnella rubrinervis]
MANNVYNDVINDVGNKLQQVFNKQTSSDDSAHLLLQVQQTWREKMVHHGVLQVPGETNTTRGGAQPLVHDLNVPFEETEELDSLTDTITLPQTSLQMPIPTTSTAEAGKSKCLLAEKGREGKATDKPAGNMKTRRLPPFMRHPSGPCRPWLNQSPGGDDANDAYEPSKKKECGIKPKAPIEGSVMYDWRASKAPRSKPT